MIISVHIRVITNNIIFELVFEIENINLVLLVLAWGYFVKALILSILIFINENSSDKYSDLIEPVIPYSEIEINKKVFLLQPLYL